ncbi:ABC-type glycerol-3-phosphate transport system substrate-binding protein [Paraburkholderia youngii]
MTQRRRLLQAAAVLGATVMLPGLVRAQSGAKKYAGVTLNVSVFSTAYTKLLQQWLPEFEAASGAKVNFDTPSFPVYNQRADLELSTRGSAYDVLNVTFIYSSRWINSGWLTPLDDFIKNPALTAADWDVKDFLPGALASETGKDGKLYGIPWNAEALLSGSSRFDLVKAAGYAYPDTTDDLVKVLRAVNKKERVAGYVADSHYGWTFVPYLQAFGGNVFRTPPDDLFPTLDTPEAIAAAEYYANLISEFGPDGGVTYTPDQVTQALMLGRTNICGCRPDLPRPTRRPRGEQDREDGELRARAEGTGRTLSWRRGAWPGHSRRLQEQGSGVVIHSVGAVEADHTANRRCRLRIARAAFGHRLEGIPHAAVDQWARSC